MSSQPSPTTTTEFVETEFKTTVEQEHLKKLSTELNSIIRDLRNRFDSDDLLEAVLRRESGKNGIKSSFSSNNQDPEPLTQETIIEPLLKSLGFEQWSREISSASNTREKIADYSIPIPNQQNIDSTQLLIEAEPINKPLENRGHGIDQVESWLSKREFQTDFGFATDGIQWVFIRYDPDAYSHDRIEWIDLNDIFVKLFINQTGEQTQPLEALNSTEIETLRRFYRTFAYDNFLAIASDARQVIKKRQQLITDQFYDTYIEVVFGVRKSDTRSARSLIGDGVVVPDTATEDDARLFAVKLMNRLIFIKFLEDKQIVENEFLTELITIYETGVYVDSFYKAFIEPLFFDLMNKHPEQRDEQIASIDLFRDIPYLNGGLFRPELDEEGTLSEKEFDVRDSVLISIIELLEQYQFSADGGPTDLDPSVLGNVFEKTINYLTGKPSDQNKELGAYYTPKEITRYSAEQTVRPALYERFQPIVQEELGWPEETFERYDTVYKLIEALPADMAIIGPLLDETNEFRVVDPAMGSGHFLTSVLEEIVGIRRALYAQNDSYPDEFTLKKTTVQNNIYGVDIVGPAVEIGKLRCWLSIIGEISGDEIDSYNVNDLALPNIAFNLRQGNSLIGYTGFPDKTDDGDGYTLQSFTEDSVRNRYENIITKIKEYQKAGKQGFPERAEQARSEAFERLQNAREELIPDLHDEFVAAGVDNITEKEVSSFDPFNWVLEFAEVYVDGGFDVVVGNPPWDRIKPDRDDFFSRYDSEFRTLRGDTKDKRQKELLEDPHITDAWNNYQQSIEVQATYFNEGPAYTMQKAKVAGRTEASENDLSSLFFERIFDITHGEGYVSQVLPGRIFHGAPTKALREYLLSETTIHSLVSFENHGIFENIDNRYNFGVVTFKNKGETETLRGIFQHKDLDILQNTDQLIEIPQKVLSDFAPASMLFPRIQDERDVGVLETCVSYPSIADESREWYANPFYPLHKTADSERFFDSPDGCDYPILTGRNFYSYSHDPTFIEDLEPPFQWSVNEDVDPDRSAKLRIREKRLRQLKRAVYDAFNGTGSMKGFVNDLLENEDNRGNPLSVHDVKLPSTVYRLGFRRVARGTDEQTLISAVIPPGPVCDYSFYVIDPFEINPTEENLKQKNLHGAYDSIFTDRELFAALGLLNSLPFDFLIRRKIDNSIPQYSFKETQVPDLSEGDEWFEYIWKRAAQLNCYGEAFEEIRDRLDISAETNPENRRHLRAEIDAAALHAYGIEREQSVFITEQYHIVSNPRVRDQAYFDLVVQKYDDLIEE